MAAKAVELGLQYSNNPTKLSEPVDAFDAFVEHFNPEQGERSLAPEVPQQEWLAHDVTELGDQPYDDSEEAEMAMDTLQIFIEDMRYDPKSVDFEREFRAFLHCDDYSYSEKTIRHLISLVLGLD